MDTQKVDVVDRIATDDDVYKHVVLPNGDVRHVRKSVVTVPGTVLSRELFETLQDGMLARTGYNGDYPRRLLPCPYKHRVEITSSQNWTVPAEVTKVDVVMVGGGQAGGRATSNATRADGGDGGEVLKLRSVAVTAGQVEAVVIGAGGVGTTSSGQAVGGNTTFLGYTAYGGGTPNASGDRGSTGGDAAAAAKIDRSGHDNGIRLSTSAMAWRTVNDYVLDWLLYGYDPYTGILYAGGGGAGRTSDGLYTGGAGAGDGGYNGPGGDAQANTGGGGGGAGYADETQRGGHGGSGIVIIYY